MNASRSSNPNHITIAVDMPNNNASAFQSEGLAEFIISAPAFIIFLNNLSGCVSSLR